jgi:hypothetical protein
VIHRDRFRFPRRLLTGKPRHGSLNERDLDTEDRESGEMPAPAPFLTVGYVQLTAR